MAKPNEPTPTTGNAPVTAMGAALAQAAKAEDAKTTATAAPANVFDALDQQEKKEDTPDGKKPGDGDITDLFTAYHFKPVASETYERSRDKRGGGVIVTGHSRKVADVEFELAHTGIYTPGAISIVQNKGETEGHLELSIGVWNPETRKTSFRCISEATKERLQAYKDMVCNDFLRWSADQKHDLSAGPKKEYAAVVKGVNLLAGNVSKT